MIQTPKSSIDENPGWRNLNEPGFLVVGRLTKPHGLKGEIVMKIITDFPERLGPDTPVYIGAQHTQVNIETARWHKKSLLIRFEGVTNREDAETLRNQWVMVREDARPELPAGEYYHHQLIGLNVVTREGQTLGEVNEILSTGANDVFVVGTESDGELLIPASDEVLLEVDLETGQIRINLISGILPE